MKTENFYKQIPAISSYNEVGVLSHYFPAPSDWYVIITDVVGSTKAIEAGKYKEVNMVGAASVASILNIAKDVDVPFVFGGDGATFLIPHSLIPKAREALFSTERLSREAFGLELRLGMVSVGHIKEVTGLDVLVSKFQLTPQFSQALFLGGGLTSAEKMIKDPMNGEFRLKGTNTAEPDLGGLTCRWNDIESLHGETVSYLVRPMVSWEETEAVCRGIVEKIDEYYGKDEMHHPVSFKNLKVALGGTPLERETRLRAGLQGKVGQALYRAKAFLKTLLFYVATKTGIPLGDINQRKYLNLLINTVEYKKFDDVFRFVISGTPEARAKLSAYLEEERKRGKIVYGTHVSNRALMTCLVFERYGKQVHFIDAADGGYTLAAKQLKAQLKDLEEAK